jgi:hypothetical protein
MILDFDYLPLPAVGAKGKAPSPRSRETTFARLDTDNDGKLTKVEFSAGRRPEDAAKWFSERDADADGFVSRDEFLPGNPIGKRQ